MAACSRSPSMGWLHSSVGGGGCLNTFHGPPALPIPLPCNFQWWEVILSGHERVTLSTRVHSFVPPQGDSLLTRLPGSMWPIQLLDPMCFQWCMPWVWLIPRNGQQGNDIDTGAHPNSKLVGGLCSGTQHHHNGWREELFFAFPGHN